VPRMAVWPRLFCTASANVDHSQAIQTWLRSNAGTRMGNDFVHFFGRVITFDQGG
jgi:hypothetical protein